MFDFPDPGGGEPVRDERLGALLRATVGEPPMTEVDWTALAERVGAAVRAHQAAPWWDHVARWQRHALPLALAAGVVGALALWQSSLGARDAASVVGSGELVTAVVSGTSSTDAALSYAGWLTSTVTADLSSEVPE
jgi:hypothetical protein